MEICGRRRTILIFFVILAVFLWLLIFRSELCALHLIHRTGDLRKAKPTDSKIFPFRSPCGCSRNSAASPLNTQIKVNYQWCSAESVQREPNQRIVSFSVFGKADKTGMKYFKFLRENAVKINQFLPGWVMRLHHNIDVETPEHKLLCEVYCSYSWVDLCDVSSLWRTLSKRRKNKNFDLRPVTGEQVFNLNRRIWRFLPLLDPQAYTVLTRDSDALISHREAAAIQQWLNSNYTFHVMRDHQAHKAHILAGMFGVKTHQRRDLVEGLTRVLVVLGKNQKYDTDQTLLSKIFWPTVMHDVMAHDSYNCMENSYNSYKLIPTYPFPTQRVNNSFVSDNFEGRWIVPEKCPIECRPTDHQDWEYC